MLFRQSFPLQLQQEKHLLHQQYHPTRISLSRRATLDAARPARWSAQVMCCHSIKPPDTGFEPVTACPGRPKPTNDKKTWLFGGEAIGQPSAMSSRSAARCCCWSPMRSRCTRPITSRDGGGSKSQAIKTPVRGLGLFVRQNLFHYISSEFIRLLFQVQPSTLWAPIYRNGLLIESFI